MGASGVSRRRGLQGHAAVGHTPDAGMPSYPFKTAVRSRGKLPRVVLK